MDKKTILKIIFFIVLLIFIVFLIISFFVAVKEIKMVRKFKGDFDKSKIARVIVDFQGKTRVFEGETPNGCYRFSDLLPAVCDMSDVKCDLWESPYGGIFLVSVGDLKNSAQSNWKISFSNFNWQKNLFGCDISKIKICGGEEIIMNVTEN